jgi:tetratricopeptide (TPR) repeat protein
MLAAVAYPKQNNIDQALQDCNQVLQPDLLQRDPRYAAAYLHRAECYLRRKQYEDALRDCLSALKLNEYREDVHLKRAAIYEDMKRAGNQLLYKRAVDADRKKALDFYYRANQYASRGEYQQALADYTVTLELFPHGFEPTRQRALLCWLHLKDFNAALSDSRDLVKFWPKKPEGYLYLALIHLGRRQYSLALEELEDVLSRQPDNLQALWGKAQIYLWQGKAKEALDVINPVVEKLPAGDATVLNLRGDIYRHLGQLDSAAKDYRRLLSLRPENLESYVSLALVYSKQGEQSKARQCLDQMVKANPKSAAAYLWRGRFLRDQGLFDEAWKDSEQEACCDPASVLPKLLQASITAARGDAAAAVDTAEQVLSSATQKDKDDGQVLYSAAQVWSLASLVVARTGDSVTAKRYSDLAVNFLEQTLDKGFHDLNYPDHNRMIDDPALEAIRQHPKAIELLAHRPR